MDQSADLTELLRATARGDREAFRALYARTSPRLLAIAMKLLGRRDLAEEALQDSFVTVWQRAATFDPDRGSAEAWMTTILRRRAIDRLRASPWIDREVPQAADVDGTLADLPTTLTLRHCLDRLDPATRHAIVLAYVYGLTHAELHERTEIPLGTIKSRLRRGVHALKSCLEE